MAGGVTPVVHVLLATCDGARHLRSQWASLEAQQGVHIVLHVADDGSSDGTPALLRELAERRSGAITAVHWLERPPRRSAARSFLLLLQDALRQFPHAQWLAFCDQDDIWLPGKLQRGLDLLRSVPANGPALYGGRTISVDEEDREQGVSEPPRRQLSFPNAVAENVIGGNTMVLNGMAARLLAASAGAQVTAHDWLAYQLVTGAGGQVCFDLQPFVRYRQHGRNVVGSRMGWRAAVLRLRRLLRGDYPEWMRQHLRELGERRGELAAANRAVLENFTQACSAKTPGQRLAALRRSGVFRQRPADQLMLIACCVFGLV